MEIRPASEWESGEPGFYHDPGEIYYQGPEISQSFLKKGRVSMLTAKRSLEVEDTDTEAKANGRAIHLYFDDRQAFADRYVVAGECCAVLGSGARKGEICGNPGKVRVDGTWFCGAHSKGLVPDDIEYVDPKVIRWIKDWTEQLSAPEAHAARAILDPESHTELAMRWIDEETGLVCRGKWDSLRIDGDLGYGHDYKSKANYRDESSLSYEIDDRGYHWQQAFYEDGSAANGVKIQDYAIVWLIKPTGSDLALCRIDRMDPAWVELGRRELRVMMDKVRGCKLTGYWPGLDLGTIGTIAAPPRIRHDIEAIKAEQENQEVYEDELPA